MSEMIGSALGSIYCNHPYNRSGMDQSRAFHTRIFTAAYIP